MFLRELKTSLDHISGVSSDREKLLSKLGITNVADLLLHFPRTYEDRSKTVPIKDYQNAEVCTVVRVLSHKYFGRNNNLKIYVEDETARAALLCFGGLSSIYAKTIPVGSTQKIFGKFEYDNRYREIICKKFTPESTQAANSTFGLILPVYPLTEDLKQGTLRNIIKQGLKQYLQYIEDEIPLELNKRYSLMNKQQALYAMHIPKNWEELKNARRTLIYEELFYLEIIIGKRALLRKSEKSDTLKIENDTGNELSGLQKNLIERLPFKLTQGQQQALSDINKDMDSPFIMARLLQGDVGCGKTLVAFLAALRAVEHKKQVAIMAPTELLARQHAENAAKLLEPLGTRVAFLTGNLKTQGRKHLLAALAAGEIDIVLGTHALFSRDVVYKDLRLVVIDEQHRFGVTQREAILSKGKHCDLLMMSATPIPRTITMTLFGDMDISVIPDLPAGRKIIKTHSAIMSREEAVYKVVALELQLGRQVYFVYPAIDTNDMDLKDATSMANNISTKIFPEYKTALVHSKIPEEEKIKIMEDFRQGIIQILVATSVVEVGVDVPNATCMVIIHAERFGLSALHQLRGRVGRSEHQSYCFLVYAEQAESGDRARIAAMREYSDGFLIAEEDLKLRGSGQIAGTEQSGISQLFIADPIRDANVLKVARNDAFAILEKDPHLSCDENKIIAQVLSRAPPFEKVGL